MGKSTIDYKPGKTDRNGKNPQSKVDRPDKPYPEFPLTAHNAGYWCKSIRGTVHYFGRWGKVVQGEMVRLPGDGWQAALELYQEQRDDLFAGRTPRKNAEGLTVRDLCEDFLQFCDRKVSSGEMQERTKYEYKRTTDRIVRVLGKSRLVSDLRPKDFADLRDDIAKTNGVVAQGSEITRARVVFNFAHKNLLIPAPVQYGLEFSRPKREQLRKQRAKNGERMLTPAEIKALLDAASPQLKAMILLGVNCGFGNTDCGTLPFAAVDLAGGWITYPRPKTGIDRRCPLWPETVEALKGALAVRPTPKQDDGHDKVFLTVRGAPWTNGSTANPISSESCKLLRQPRCPECGKLNAPSAEECNGCKWKPSAKEPWLTIYRKGIGFYTLRHVFRTIADATRDQVAVRHIMGHADESIDAHYRERIDDSRLRAVSDHVRAWLFGEGTSNG